MARPRKARGPRDSGDSGMRRSPAARHQGSGHRCGCTVGQAAGVAVADRCARSTGRNRAASSSFSQITAARGFSGGVCSGLVEPKTATCGHAEGGAATCIRPESLLTTPARPGDHAPWRRPARSCPPAPGRRGRKSARPRWPQSSPEPLPCPNPAAGRQARCRSCSRRGPAWRNGRQASTWPGRTRRPAPKRPSTARRPSDRAPKILLQRRAAPGQTRHLRTPGLSRCHWPSRTIHPTCASA